MSWDMQALRIPQLDNNIPWYNKTTFLHSCRTMLCSLRRPPEHFGDLVAGHFQERGRTILAACKHYLAGNMVGSQVPKEEEAEYDGQPRRHLLLSGWSVFVSS